MTNSREKRTVLMFSNVMATGGTRTICAGLLGTGRG
jgi:hypothetical protein